MVNNEDNNNPTAENPEQPETEESINESPGEQKANSEAGAEEEYKKQIEKLQSDILYLKADFENYKKRMIRERSEYIKYGAESLVVALLDLVDNFERAMAIEIKPENLKSFSEGISMIAGQFKETLNRFGVSEVKAQGEPFDPTYHEAMGAEPSSKHPPGTITQVFTKPYKLHDKVIRHGKVVVAAAPKTDDSNGKEEDN